MHEMTIAQNLIEIIKDEMIRHDAKALKSALLHVGQLTAIVPESLSFCFEVMTSGTEMEGAELIIEIIPLKAMCRECEKTFEVQDYAFECPHCGSSDIKTVAGQELSIVEMEVN